MAAILQLSKHFPCTADYAARHAREPRHMNAVTAVGSTGGDIPQEHNLSLILSYNHVVVECARQCVGKLRQFVVVSGEQGLAAKPGVIVYMLGDRSCQSQPVIGAGAASYLVQDYK